MDFNARQSCSPMPRGTLPKSTKLNPFLNAYKQTQQPRRKGFDIVCNNLPQQFSLNLTQEELARKS